MKTMEVEKMGFQPIMRSEMFEITGGDTGYYGKGPNLDRLEYLAHEVGDFFRGLFDGLFR